MVTSRLEAGRPAGSRATMAIHETCSLGVSGQGQGENEQARCEGCGEKLSRGLSISTVH